MRGKFILLALNLLHVAPPSAAGDDARGRVLAAGCAACHAPHAAAADGIPRIHGRPAAELIAQLDRFRTGPSDATLMHQLVPGYSREELQLVAEHLARQP